MVLNSTNGQIIAAACAAPQLRGRKDANDEPLDPDDTDNWVGVKIVLYDDPNVSFGGKLVGGIRVRAPRQPKPAAAPAPARARPAPAPRPATADVPSPAPRKPVTPATAPSDNDGAVEDPDDVPF